MYAHVRTHSQAPALTRTRTFGDKQAQAEAAKCARGLLLLERPKQMSHHFGRDAHARVAYFNANPTLILVLRLLH